MWVDCSCGIARLGRGSESRGPLLTPHVDLGLHLRSGLLQPSRRLLRRQGAPLLRSVRLLEVHIAAFNRAVNRAVKGSGAQARSGAGGRAGRGEVDGAPRREALVPGRPGAGRERAGRLSLASPRYLSVLYMYFSNFSSM